MGHAVGNVMEAAQREQGRSQPATAILAATLRVIARGGVDGVRFREVAREAELPLGTVSYHFQSRTDLIHAAFEYFLEESAETVATARAQQPPDTLEDLAELLALLARTYLGDRERCLAEFELMVFAGRVPELSEALAEWDRFRENDLAAVLEGFGVARPNAAARSLIEIVRGFQLANLGRPEPDFDECENRISAVLRGLARAG